jgi:hypothetical protein
MQKQTYPKSVFCLPRKSIDWQIHCEQIQMGRLGIDPLEKFKGSITCAPHSFDEFQ